MNLLTAEILKKFNTVRNQENNPDPIVIAKYFYGSWTWFATEFYPEDRLFFGYVDGHESEWGYFSLYELETIRSGYGLTVERDLYAGYQSLSSHLKTLGIANF